MCDAVWLLYPLLGSFWCDPSFSAAFCWRPASLLLDFLSRLSFKRFADKSNTSFLSILTRAKRATFKCKNAFFGGSEIFKLLKIRNEKKLSFLNPNFTGIYLKLNLARYARIFLVPKVNVPELLFKRSLPRCLCQKRSSLLGWKRWWDGSSSLNLNLIGFFLSLAKVDQKEE